MKPTRKLRQLLAAEGAIQVGGAADAGQARLVEHVGYPAVYISGSYVNHTRGYPDGTLTLSEIAGRIAEVAERVSIPVIADADEGFGGVLKIARVMRDYERAGAAALHMEDYATKKHGLPMPVKQMQRNLQVLLDTRQDPDFVIIARCDAMAPWRQGLNENPEACEEETFERVLAYCDAGADAVMPLYASNSWLRRYGPRIPRPLVVLGGAPKNSFGPTVSTEREPELHITELAKYNVKVVIYSTTMLSRSYRFMKQEYASWLAAGKFDFTSQDEEDRAFANRLIGYPEKEAMLNKYGE